MNKIYLVQGYPFEDWETIKWFENEAAAVDLCASLKANHPGGNFRVYAINDISMNRDFFNVQESNKG